MRVAGWVGVALFLLALFAVAWVWCGMSYAEEFSEEAKAQSAGTTMVGWGFAWGLIPVLVLHALVAVGVFVAVHDGGRRRVLSSVATTAVVMLLTSLPGFVAAQMLFGGTMFAPPVYVP